MGVAHHEVKSDRDSVSAATIIVAFGAFFLMHDVRVNVSTWSCIVVYFLGFSTRIQHRF